MRTTALRACLPGRIDSPFIAIPGGERFASQAPHDPERGLAFAGGKRAMLALPMVERARPGAIDERIAALLRAVHDMMILLRARRAAGGRAPEARLSIDGIRYTLRTPIPDAHVFFQDGQEPHPVRNRCAALGKRSGDS